MPIYAFHCAACSFSFDLLRRIDDRDDSAPCLNCGSFDTIRDCAPQVVGIAHRPSTTPRPQPGQLPRVPAETRRGPGDHNVAVNITNSPGGVMRNVSIKGGGIPVGVQIDSNSSVDMNGVNIENCGTAVRFVK